jgi:plasmid stability protein
MADTEFPMTLTIQLPQETERRLRERAATVGMPPEALVSELVATGLSSPTLDEDIKRFRDAVLASGETQEETAAFFQSIVDQVRAERSGSGK